MIAQNQIFDQTYLPFIEKVSMSYDDSHILKVKVKEKLRTGVFKYMNEYVYFNENGIAMESRNTLFEGVPVVTGVKFNEMNLKKKILENKVPVKKNYFNTIVSITKKITTYKLNVSEIHFEGEDDITLTSLKYKIYLGSSSYLDGKMSKLSSILETVSSNYKKGPLICIYIQMINRLSLLKRMISKRQRTSGDIFLIFQGNYGNFHRSQKKTQKIQFF